MIKVIEHFLFHNDIEIQKILLSTPTFHIFMSTEQDEDQGVYSSISISLCCTRHISNGCCRTLQIFSILEYHAKNISRIRNIDEWSM
jgi:hypothetical protein